MRDRFLEGMSYAACTVNVVTTDGAHGRAGVTVSAMCSVSADPPSLLVCVHHLSCASEIIRNNGVLCVNVLRDDQASISDTFAGRIPTKSDDKFSCAVWRRCATGSPVLENALVAFDCRVVKHFRSGSHYIFVADVAHIEIETGGSPLIHANRAYGTAVLLPTASSGTSPADHDVTVGCFLTLGPFFMPRLLRGFRGRSPGTRVQIREGDQGVLRAGLERGEIDLALLYDFELGVRFAAEPLVEIAPHVLLPAAHRLADAASVSLKDLAAEPMVLLDIAPSRDYFRSLFEEIGLEPTIALNSPSFETVRGLVANGMGYSLLVTKPANAMSYDGASLVTRPIREPVTPGRIALARRAGDTLSVGAREFADHCRSFFSSAPIRHAA